MRTQSFLGSGALGAALLTTLLAPAAPAAAQDSSVACAVPISPTNAEFIRRALGNGSGADFDRDGVRTLTEVDVRSTEVAANGGWTMRGILTAGFSFKPSGPFGKVDTQRFKNLGLKYGLSYDPAAGMLAASVSGTQAELLPYKLTATGTVSSDTTVTRDGSATIGVEGTVTRGEIERVDPAQPANPNQPQAPTNPGESLKFGVQVGDVRVSKKRTITAVATLPADRRIVLRCDPATSTISIGQELKLAAGIEFDTELIGQTTTEMKTLNANATLKAKGVSIGGKASTQKTVDREAIDGRVAVSVEGSGLSTSLDLDPGLTENGRVVPFRNKATFSFELRVKDQPLVTATDVSYDVFNKCDRNRNCIE